MKYTLSNGKTINIPDKELDNLVIHLGVTRTEAISIWLEDAEYEENAEQIALNEKASKIKINHGASAEKPKKKSEKPRTTKTSDAKKELFSKLSYYLNEFCEENDANYTILKENKLIELQFADKTFKIDLIEQRPKKKS